MHAGCTVSVLLRTMAAVSFRADEMSNHGSGPYSAIRRRARAKRGRDVSVVRRVRVGRDRGEAALMVAASITGLIALGVAIFAVILLLF